MNNIQQLNQVLQTFRIDAVCQDAHQIANYAFYDLRLQDKTKVKDIAKYSDEISLALKTLSKPNIKVLHSSGLVRLEFASSHNYQRLDLLDFFTNDNVPSGDLMCLLGQTVDGNRIWMDLAQNPHMIIAGTTGSGKSTLLHNILANMFNYNDPIIFLIDPKKIEFPLYRETLPDRVQKMACNIQEANALLDNTLRIMEDRFRHIRQGTDPKSLPYILLMIDEFADLIMQDQKDKLDGFLGRLCRLSQKCRAARISIILSTQRPTVNVVSGTLKANFPARIACKVATHIDSKVILDASGAENLFGRGDAMLRDNTRHLERFQVAHTTAEEVCRMFGKVK